MTTREVGRGKGNAMRWILTGDTFDVVEAHRMGLAQELVPVGEPLQQAMQIASQAEVDPLAGRQPDGRRSINA